MQDEDIPIRKRQLHGFAYSNFEDRRVERVVAEVHVEALRRICRRRENQHQKTDAGYMANNSRV